MEKIFSFYTPNGSRLSIDLSDYKLSHMKKNGNLNIQFYKSSPISAEGSEEELKKIADEIDKKANEYEEAKRTLELKHEVMEKAVNSGLELSKEVIKDVALKSIKDEASKLTDELKTSLAAIADANHHLKSTKTLSSEAKKLLENRKNIPDYIIATKPPILRYIDIRKIHGG